MNLQWVYEPEEVQSGCGDSWVLRDMDTGMSYDIRDGNNPPATPTEDKAK